MLTEKEKNVARALWHKTCHLLPTDNLVMMYVTAYVHVHDPESAAEAARKLTHETPESLKEKAEFTLELIVETLDERGVEIEKIEIGRMQ